MRQHVKREEQTKMKIGGFLYILGLFLIMLIIFFVSGTFSEASSADTEHRYKYYTNITVMQGDSLWDIAEEYISEDYESIEEYIEEIESINNISAKDTLISGCNLIIPYYSSEFRYYDSES